MPPTLTQVRATNEKLFTSSSSSSSSSPFVAVVSGGTSGIGEHTIRALATHGKNLRVYIIGRNEASANALISDCQKLCPTGAFRFVRAVDLSLLKDVDRICGEIKEMEEKEVGAGKGQVDLLVMTHAEPHLLFETSARSDTTEGIDRFMSQLYYSRMRFITSLLPLLHSSHIVSVFSPKRDATLLPADLSLRDPKNYGFVSSGSHVSYMTTFFFEELAKRHPGKLSLAHYFPGLVVTKGFDDDRFPRWFKIVWRWLAMPLNRIFKFTVPQDESGERVLGLADGGRFPARDVAGTAAGEVAESSDGQKGGGAYRVDWNGGIIPTKVDYVKLREEGVSEKIWEHTMKAFEEVDAGRVFEG